jgi:hypothetical protein
MPTDDTSIALLPERFEKASLVTSFARIGTVVALTPDGAPLVLFDGAATTTPARLAVPATFERLERAIIQRQPTVLVFENGDCFKPLIVGFVELVQEPIENSSAAQSQVATTEVQKPPFIEADVDGKRVRVTAHDEIVLQCGSASVTLRRNGRVVIRGTYVETHSEGTNRIKGGQVQIN